MSGPDFQLLREDVVHRGHAVDVAVGHFRAPDGSEFTRDIVHHPGAVGVLPLHEDGTVTVVRQFRAPIDTELVEIPAGLRDVDGEAPEVTAARELVEEVGLRADTMTFLCSFHNSAGHSDEKVEVYVATGLHEVDHDRQGPEERAMEVERHPLEDLVAMIRSGAITDAKTMIAVLLVAGDTAAG